MASSTNHSFQKELSYMTPQEISDLEDNLREKRSKLTLFQQPSKTFYLFLSAFWNIVKNSLVYITSHPILIKILLPLLVVWYLLEFIPGPYTETINSLEFSVQYVVWWIGLGILSSIGLGSGLQTGVLFLFPHIMRVCLTAQTCKSVNFNSLNAIWFNDPETHNLFKCLEEPTEDTPPPRYLDVWLLVLLPSFLQATGTAIGEIPPYWVTKAARQAAIDSGEKLEVPEELESNSEYSFINRWKGKLITFLRTHGFLGVFLMAAWPNFAFDLCGICCGHFLMPFWTFFGATFLGKNLSRACLSSSLLLLLLIVRRVGKAVVRNTYQTLILVALFSEQYLNLLIEYVQVCVPSRYHSVVEEYFREALEEMKSSAHHHSSPDSPSDSHPTSHSVLSILWGSLMTFILTFFCLSCINQFAQLYQALIDKDTIDELKHQLPLHIQKELTSPATGKIVLPPPSNQMTTPPTTPTTILNQQQQQGQQIDANEQTSFSDRINSPASNSPSAANRDARINHSSPSLVGTLSQHQSFHYSPSNHTPSPKKSSSFSLFNQSPSRKSEYSPGNAFVLSVIDTNRNRARANEREAQRASRAAQSQSAEKEKEKDKEKEKESSSVPMVVRRVNLFNFSTGTIDKRIE